MCTLVVRHATVMSIVFCCACASFHVPLCAEGMSVWVLKCAVMLMCGQCFRRARHTANATLIVCRRTLCRFRGVLLLLAWQMRRGFFEQVFAQVRQAAVVLASRSMSFVILVDYCLRLRVSRKTTGIFLASVAGFVFASVVFVASVFLSSRILR